MRRLFVAASLAAIFLSAATDGAAAQEDKRPSVVRVGVLVNDIQQLDLQSHSYNVDMYMWFTWRTPTSTRRGRSSP